MSPPSEVNLEKLRFSGKEIDGARNSGFKTTPDFYGYEGRLSDRRRVIMFPEVDIKSRWYSECEGTGKSGFIYSDELKILSRLHHENFLPFIGYCDENNVFFQHDDVHGDKVLRMSVE
ncbi:hypothetical protein Tco_0243858 [Tanacetum coccineum]